MANYNTRITQAEMLGLLGRNESFLGGVLAQLFRAEGEKEHGGTLQGGDLDAKVSLANIVGSGAEIHCGQKGTHVCLLPRASCRVNDNDEYVVCVCIYIHIPMRTMPMPKHRHKHTHKSH